MVFAKLGIIITAAFFWAVLSGNFTLGSDELDEAAKKVVNIRDRLEMITKQRMEILEEAGERLRESENVFDDSKATQLLNKAESLRREEESARRALRVAERARNRLIAPSSLKSTSPPAQAVDEALKNGLKDSRSRLTTIGKAGKFLKIGAVVTAWGEAVAKWITMCPSQLDRLELLETKLTTVSTLLKNDLYKNRCDPEWGLSWCRNYEFYLRSRKNVLLGQISDVKNFLNKYCSKLLGGKL